MEKDLLKLINESAKDIEKKFLDFIKELAYGLSLRYGMPQDFFIEYLKKQKKVLFDNVKQAIYNYLNKADFKAYMKVSNFIDRFFGKDIEQISTEILLKKVKINLNKKFISDRIWKYTDDFIFRLQNYIQTEAWQGRSAITISENILNFLKTGLNSNGEFVMKMQGRGIYRNPINNAMRLVRTEVNRAYRLREHTQIKHLNFVKGIKINLSAMHPKTDICDDLQGIYPKDFVFTGWHPHCICYPTYITTTKEEAINLIKNKKDAPQVKINRNFVKWYQKNRYKWESGKIKTPRFIDDNKDFLKNF